MRLWPCTGGGVWAKTRSWCGAEGTAKWKIQAPRSKIQRRTKVQISKAKGSLAIGELEVLWCLELLS